MRLSMKLAGLATAVALAAGPATASTAPVCAPGGPWTASWGTSQDHGQAVGPWSNQTLRMVAHVSVGGAQLRVRLSNEFATAPVTFTHVSIAPQLDGAVTAGAPTVVTFGGAMSVTMAAGVETASDPVPLATTSGERLLVSVYIPATASVPSAAVHTYSGETEYNIVGSDATTVVAPPVTNAFGFTAYVAGVDVDANSALTIVAAGDSITDLGGSGTDTDDRWPDYLSRRTTLAVVNAGISGNWVTQDQGSTGGPSLVNRWQHDVLGVPGVRTAIIAAGINDLRGGVSATTLEQAIASLVASGHAAGLRVLVATITPCAGEPKCTTAVQGQIGAYNSWAMAGSSGADGVPDLSAAVSAGAALAGMYDSGDHLHPNAAGMLAMAGAVDVSRL